MLVVYEPSCSKTHISYLHTGTDVGMYQQLLGVMLQLSQRNEYIPAMRQSVERWVRLFVLSYPSAVHSDGHVREAAPERHDTDDE